MEDTNSIINHNLFNEISLDKATSLTCEALNKYQHGELFCEYNELEVVSLDDNYIKNISFNTDKGFGLRGVIDDFSCFVYSSAINEDNLKIASNKLINLGTSANIKLNAVNNTNSEKLYNAVNPNPEVNQQNRVELLHKINSYLRNKDSRVKEVSCSIVSNWQLVSIIKHNGQICNDIRPMVKLNVNVLASDQQNRESGSYSSSGRYSINEIFKEEYWQHAADEALRQALILISAKPAPAGQMPVVLSNGLPGVLLHEAVGHGLEGDHTRKKASLFSGKIGEQVASKGVTVVDQGNIKGNRGSLFIDDEGNPTQRNVLIEDGILKGFMQDSMNAKLMNMAVTGNGRRESYSFQPIPRMTNTFMLEGEHNQEEMISELKKGIFAKSFSGGQVDITAGNFVFAANEAYMIEDGKITHPVKGATLIGNGLDVMQKIKMIGNDLELDPGNGTCGKNGQGVPVNVGQPSLLVENITVGGTDL